MKKEYLIGLLTGCLLTASALMFMGATDTDDSKIGKYQMTAYAGVGGGTVYRLVDTTDGQLYKWVVLKGSWKALGKPVE